MSGHADEAFMRQAISMAIQAEQAGEVPVGAVLVKDDIVIAEGWNRPVSDCDPTAHAEIIALREGARIVGNYRLCDTTLYVTMEPCPMCAGAMVNARVGRLVFGVHDLRFGAAGTIFDVVRAAESNHRMDVAGGILEQDCRNLLQQFFKIRRQSAN